MEKKLMTNNLTPDIAWIYELRWAGTNEIYIGSTSSTPEERLKQHQHQPRSCYAHLGIENAELGFCFDYKPAHNTDRSAEARWKRLSAAFGYKILDNGDCYGAPLKHSKASKAKISEAKKGEKHHMYGKQHSNETKAKIGSAQKGAKNYRYAPFTVTFPDGTVDRWETTSEAAAAYGVGVMTIWRYLNGVSIPGGAKRTAHLKDTIWSYLP